MTRNRDYLTFPTWDPVAMALVEAEAGAGLVGTSVSGVCASVAMAGRSWPVPATTAYTSMTLSHRGVFCGYLGTPRM